MTLEVEVWIGVTIMGLSMSGEIPQSKLEVSAANRCKIPHEGNLREPVGSYLEMSGRDQLAVRGLRSSYAYYRPIRET